MKTAVFPNTSGITARLYTQRPSAGHKDASKIYNYHLIPEKCIFKQVPFLQQLLTHRFFLHFTDLHYIHVPLDL